MRLLALFLGLAPLCRGRGKFHHPHEVILLVLGEPLGPSGLRSWVVACSLFSGTARGFVDRFCKFTVAGNLNPLGNTATHSVGVLSLTTHYYSNAAKSALVGFNCARLPATHACAAPNNHWQSAVSTPKSAKSCNVLLSRARPARAFLAASRAAHARGGTCPGLCAQTGKACTGTVGFPCPRPSRPPVRGARTSRG